MTVGRIGFALFLHDISLLKKCSQDVLGIEVGMEIKLGKDAIRMRREVMGGLLEASGFVLSWISRFLHEKREETKVSMFTIKISSQFIKYISCSSDTY